MNTLTEVAEKCYNYIELVGTLTEWNVNVYEKNDTIVIKYIGVVDCDNAYINIKGVLTQYDDLFKGFVDEFKDGAPPNQKVFVRGKLNAQGGVTVWYISKSYCKNDMFRGEVCGIPLSSSQVLVVDKEYHQILPIHIDIYIPNCTHRLKLCSNPIRTDENHTIIDGYPPIVLKETELNYAGDKELFLFERNNEVPQYLIDQALEEHEIYLESMGQKTSG